MDNNLRKKIKEAIIKVTEAPEHKVSEDSNDASSKNALYSEREYDLLEEKIYNIIKTYHLDNESIPEDAKVLIIKDYLKNNVRIRDDYFYSFLGYIPEIPKDELKYRTAYSALFKGETMCAGYTEACRILLESVGIKTQTLVSKLPGTNKKLLHYVTLAQFSDGSAKVLDPEREASCERKGYDFQEYQNNMDFILPNENFCENKVGKSGVGILVDDFIQDAQRNRVGPQMFYLDRGDDGEILCYLVDRKSKYNPANNENYLQCQNLLKFLSTEKFMKFVQEENPVFVAHGPENAEFLLLVANQLEKENSEMLKSLKNQSQRGE